MSSKTEETVAENATNDSNPDDGDEEEKIDQSVLDGYMTDDNQVKAP